MILSQLFKILDGIGFRDHFERKDCKQYTPAKWKMILKLINFYSLKEKDVKRFCKQVEQETDELPSVPDMAIKIKQYAETRKKNEKIPQKHRKSRRNAKK